MILVSFFSQFLNTDKNTQLFVDFGVANNRILMKVNECYVYMRKINSLAMITLLLCIQRLRSFDIIRLQEKQDESVQ